MEIKLMNGNSVKLDTKLNIKKLMLINKDFNTDELVKMSFSGKTDEQSITIIQGVQAVYVAYRQANMETYLSFEEFLSEDNGWEFDMEVALPVYYQLMFKQARDEYKKTFEKASKGKF